MLYSTSIAVLVLTKSIPLDDDDDDDDDEEEEEIPKSVSCLIASCRKNRTYFIRKLTQSVRTAI